MWSRSHLPAIFRTDACCQFATERRLMSNHARLSAFLPSITLLMAANTAFPSEDWSLSANGNMQFDVNRIDTGDSLNASSGIRRTRVALSAKVPNGFDAKVEFDVHANQWTDAYLRWRPNGNHALKLGQFKQPLYLDELSSDKASMFMEQGLPSAFAIARRIGAEYAWSTPQWRASFSAYDGNLTGRLGGQGIAARAIWSPLNSADSVLHFAVSAATEQPDNDNARFNSRAEASNFSPRLFDTGSIANVDRIRRTGLEALWIKGSWSAQSEYLRSELSRSVAPDLSFDGWYAQASWFPSGDHRGYKDGAIDSPDLGEDGSAFELALRVSHLDLNHGDVRGGNGTNYSAGATWYINKKVRTLVNYIHVDGHRGATVLDPNILEARVQLSF